MADIRFDLGGLTVLASDLAALPAGFESNARGVIAKAGVTMKAAMRAEASGSSRFRRIPESISYSVTDGGFGVDVGPEQGRGQGSLAHIAYFGSPTSGPRFPDPVGVLEREAPVTAAWLGKALDGLL